MVITLDLTKVKASPEVIKTLEAMQSQLLSLDRRKRSSKGLDRDGLLTALTEALKESPSPKPRPTGRNKALVELFNHGFVYEDGEKVDAYDLTESFAKLLETCPGVAVDHEQLQMSEVFGQWVLRAYNRPEVGLLAKPQPDDEDSD